MEASLSTKCQFTAYKCNSWDEYNTGKCADSEGDTRMGYASASLPGRGNHYLETMSDYPFC